MENQKKDMLTIAEQQGVIYAPFKPDEEAPYIFVSYSHLDRNRVFPIITRLYEKGWRVWYDEGLEVTENYYTSLSRHIKNCTVFLLFVTENSVNSEFVCEHELLLAASSRKRICVCTLDENAEFTDEAKDAIDIATASKKNPKTDEYGLEAALDTIHELKRFEPRKAEGYKILKNNIDIIEAAEEGDEYYFEKCDGGIRLGHYRGSDENVIIPQKYKGQIVTELGHTFCDNKTIRCVHIPSTVKAIRCWTFADCINLADLYIPSSVQIWETNFRFPMQCRIHCVEGSPAHEYAVKHNFLCVVEQDFSDDNAVKKLDENVMFAYCSYSHDVAEEAKRIIQSLLDNDCSVIDSETLSDKEKLISFRRCDCFIALVSQGYIEDVEIEYLRMAQTGKNYIIYVIDNCTLPSDIEITNNKNQMLRFDSGTEIDRLTKLINWLDENNCRKKKADIPDYEYTTDRDGELILTRYTGNRSNVIIPQDYAGHPIMGLSGTFARYYELTSVTIPDSVYTITNRAFYMCQFITSIVLPKNLRYIGYEAFCECDRLCSIEIPYGVTCIGEYAFSLCGLQSITIANSVIDIKEGAFYGCNFKSVVIPNSVKTIGNRTFEYCGNLTSIIIPDSVESIGEAVFEKCRNLTVYCHEKSEAWKYCEEHSIPYKPIDEFSETPTENTIPDTDTEREYTIDASSEKAEPDCISVTESTPSEIATFTSTMNQRPRYTRLPTFITILLILIAIVAGIQLSGLYDLIGWLHYLLG